MEPVVEQKKGLRIKNHHVVIIKRMKHEEGSLKEMDFLNLKKPCGKMVLSSILHARLIMEMVSLIAKTVREKEI